MPVGDDFKWSMLIAHRHWITFTLNGKSLNICARCLGVIIGFIIFFILTNVLQLQFFTSLALHFQIMFCLILATPAIFDWITQTWKLREGNNTIRFLTGILEAGGAVFLWLTPISLWNKIFILIFASGIALNIGFLWEKDVISRNM